MSKLIHRLASKIRNDTGLEVDPSTFVSYRPKPAHKSAGAWSWKMDTIHFGKTISKPWTVGSMWTATECCRKDVTLISAHESLNEIELVPEDNVFSKENA